jgi:endonuclease III
MHLVSETKRTSCETLWACCRRAASALDVEQKLVKFTPPEFMQHAHHWLILQGRYVCLARKPKCPECLIRNLCDFRGKTKWIPACAGVTAVLAPNGL